MYSHMFQVLMKRAACAVSSEDTRHKILTLVRFVDDCHQERRKWNVATEVPVSVA